MLVLGLTTQIIPSQNLYVLQAKIKIWKEDFLKSLKGQGISIPFK